MNRRVIWISKICYLREKGQGETAEMLCEITQTNVNTVLKPQYKLLGCNKFDTTN